MKDYVLYCVLCVVFSSLHLVVGLINFKVDINLHRKTAAVIRGFNAFCAFIPILSPSCSFAVIAIVVGNGLARERHVHSCRIRQVRCRRRRHRIRPVHVEGALKSLAKGKPLSCETIFNHDISSSRWRVVVGSRLGWRRLL